VSSGTCRSSPGSGEIAAIRVPNHPRQSIMTYPVEGAQARVRPCVAVLETDGNGTWECLMLQANVTP
jgi:hypothetical protein